MQIIEIKISNMKFVIRIHQLNEKVKSTSSLDMLKSIFSGIENEL